MAAEGNELLVTANGALLTFDAEGAIAAITAIAERVFGISPFTPDPVPTGGTSFAAGCLANRLASVSAGQAADTLQFVEGGLVYRLPWAMEAIRVRGLANGDTIERLWHCGWMISS